MIIWAFPGMGKTEFAKANKEYVDADVRKFMFRDVKDETLHGATASYERDDAFPQNFIAYVKQFEHDEERHVLINCNLGLCRCFNDVMFVYPDSGLKEIMAKRYERRGDQQAFISDMVEAYPDMIEDLNHYPTTKKIVVKKDIFLSALKGEIELMLMTKNDLVGLISEGIKYNIFQLENNTFSCSTTNCLSDAIIGVGTEEDVAQALFEGKAFLNTELVKKAVRLKKEGLEREAQKEINRQGFSRKEIEDLLMDAMVSGVATPYYGEVSPYTHGYELRYAGAKGSSEAYAIHGFFELPLILAGRIEDGAYHLDLLKLQEEVQLAEAETKEIDTYTTAAELGWELDGWNRHIHSLKDVHALKGLDAIVQGKCYGTYSNCMASNQNDLIEQMVMFKGFCLDNLLSVGRAESIRKEYFVVALQEYHARHGLDISSPEKIEEWAMNHPNATLNREKYVNAMNKRRGR